jgi:hypothetical protein
MVLHPLHGEAPWHDREDGADAGDDETRSEGAAVVPPAPPRRRLRRRGPWRRPPNESEVARLVAEFHARGGAVTRCPPVCLVPIRNGAGLDAPPRREE